MTSRAKTLEQPFPSRTVETNRKNNHRGALLATARILLAFEDDALQIHDANTGRFITTFIDHANEVNFYTFSHTGWKALPASLDITAKR